MKRTNTQQTNNPFKKQVTLERFVSQSQPSQPNQPPQEVESFTQTSQSQSSSQDISSSSTQSKKYSSKVLNAETDWLESLFKIKKEGFHQLQNNASVLNTINTYTTPTPPLRHPTCTVIGFGFGFGFRGFGLGLLLWVP